jgi:methyl-accepting chemotaxis protein
MFKGRSHSAELAKSLATDSITANVMVADADLTILYLNGALTGLLKQAEADIRKDLPRFSVASLIGSNIDVFHKKPEHQRRMLEQLKAQHRATITVGGHSFDLVVTPLADKASKRCGFVVEWADATIRLQNLEYAAQAEAISRAQAVIEFKMDGTIVTANENFLRTMGYSLPEIVGKHHSMFIGSSGRSSIAANMMRPNTGGSARVARRSGFSPPTIPSSIRTASRSRWSSSQPTSPRRSCAMPISPARSRQSASRRP